MKWLNKKYHLIFVMFHILEKKKFQEDHKIFGYITFFSYNPYNILTDRLIVVRNYIKEVNTMENRNRRYPTSLYKDLPTNSYRRSSLIANNRYANKRKSSNHNKQAK